MGTKVKYTLTFAVGVIAGIFFMMLVARGNCGTEIMRETVTDTIPFYKPVPVDSIVTRFDTVKLPSVQDTIPYRDTIIFDSVNVVVPISQKKYEDSTYTAWVSGYKPSLDSISIYPRRDIITMTNYVMPKTHRFSISLQVGYGATVESTPRLAPYIGVGLSYNLINF